MNEYLFLIPISVFLLIGVMSPGPSFVLVAQTAMAKSRLDAIAVSIGMGIGAVIFATIASVGLFVVLNSVPWLYVGLKIIGGSYLCFLAFKMWKAADDPLVHNSSDNGAAYGIVKMFFIGLLTQLSNPKTAIVFASAFAAFLPQEPPDYAYLLIVIFAFLIDSLWYMLVSILLSTAKAQKVYAKFKSVICKLASGFMGAMGVRLLSNQQP